MIAVYGHLQGEASFSQVTRGIRRAASHWNILAGVVAIDVEGDDILDGLDAPVSLNCGTPPALLMAHRLGLHKEHWLMLAPNGETFPDSFMEGLTKPSEICPNGLLDGGLLTPSRWGAGVLKRHFPDHEIIVAPHGVMPEVHYVREKQRDVARQDYEDGRFYCLHLASGETERKGTAKLVEAWGLAKRRKLISEHAILVAVVPPPELNKLRFLGHKANLREADMLAVPGFGLDQRGVVETLYSPSHIICQPSRGEGFGMVPLEGRACGVPVVATDCTGHSEHMVDSLPHMRGPAPGAVIIATGDSEPMDDFRGSMAPSLRVEDIAESLGNAYENWKDLDDAARNTAPDVQEHWTWERRNAGALKRLKERGKEHVRRERRDDERADQKSN
jgi:glycosyltransferase involved in cell wall biosynthesis